MDNEIPFDSNKLQVYLQFFIFLLKITSCYFDKTFSNRNIIRQKLQQ
jgi:hypothetical protein